MSTGFPDYLSGFQQPSTLYVSASDKLRVAAASSQSSETVTVYYRVWNTARQIVQGSFSVSPASNRTVSTTDQDMPEGFLLSVSCKATAATTRGQTFARVFLTNATVGLGNPASMLMADYVTTRSAPAYPSGRQTSPCEGPGLVRQVSIPFFGAGADWSVVVPTNARWRVMWVTGVFTASANPGNRFPSVLCGTSAPVAARVIVPTVITAGQSWGLTWSSSNPAYSQAGAGSQCMPLGVGYLFSAVDGTTIFASTVGLDPADAWSSTAIYVEEWLDNV